MICKYLSKQLLYNIKCAFYVLTLMIFPICSNAQDSSNHFLNYVSLEGQVYPSFNTDQYKPQVKLRYFFNERSALRLNINISRESNYFEIRGINVNGIGSVERISSLHQISFGYEGFKKINKTAIYSGIEGIFGFGRNNEYGSRTDSLVFIADQNYNLKKPIRQLGLRIFSGLDQYLTKHFFIGTEIGIQFIQTNYLEGYFQVIDGSSQTSTDVRTVIPKSRDQIFSFGGLGSIRVGWVF